ncbi:MAG: hypothetical protein HWD92_01985 [Flavobacteriia bacterium]|nr:hypothetical protein [Flavobacteriia bacterium]
MKKWLSLIVGLVFQVTSALGQQVNLSQEEEPYYRPASIILEGGTVVAFSQIAFEYQYFYKPNRLDNGYQYYWSANFQLGRILSLNDERYYFRRVGLQWGTRIGKRAEQVEIGVGAIYHHSESSSLPLPDLHIAYVYQPSQNGFTFRAGLGFPDGVFLGIGTRF